MRLDPKIADACLDELAELRAENRRLNQAVRELERQLTIRDQKLKFVLHELSLTLSDLEKKR